MCAGSPPIAERVSTGRAPAPALTATETATRSESDNRRIGVMRAPPSVPGDLADGLQHVAGLRQNGLFEIRVVGDRNVLRGDPLDRGVEVLEEMLRDPRGELGAESTRQLV